MSLDNSLFILSKHNCLDSMIIEMTKQKINEAKGLAEVTHKRFCGLRGHYNNTPKSHFLGHLGEIAYETYFHSNNYKTDSLFRESSSTKNCDIVLTSDSEKIRIEVKTWSEHYWEDLGRCIAVDQIEKLKNKCDIIVWCIVKQPVPDYFSETISCFIDVGLWSTLNDISESPVRLTGRCRMRKVNNFQVDIGRIRSEDELKNEINKYLLG